MGKQEEERRQGEEKVLENNLPESVFKRAEKKKKWGEGEAGRLLEEP